jgi:Mn-dependent DtxR family transcriptional regulator
LSLKQQNYVEAIDELIRTNGSARPADLAARLEVSAPSVSEAVGRLVDHGIAVRKSWHEIGLSARGRRVARVLAQRHRTLRRFMTDILGMDPRSADENACRVEHCISRMFAERLTSFADFLDENVSDDLKRDWQRRMRRAKEAPLP